MQEIRDHALRAVEGLPAGVLRLDEPADYRVLVSDGLVRLTEDLQQRMQAVAG